jgi:predicted transcriptional regulator
MDHTNCTLSKWYETEGKELFGNTKQYKEIYKPHKMVHEYAEKSIQEVIDSGISRESMGNLIDNFTAMEEASQKLFSLLDDMVKEKFSERVTS